MKNPKVSVIIPVLNGETTIRNCINSIKAQSYPDVEIVIVDGGSIDSTIDIIKTEQVNFISEKDAGIYDAFNKGILMAKGDIIHILNSDDYYAHKDVISRAIEIMSTEDLDLCHGVVEQVDSNNKRIWSIGKDVTKKQLLNGMKVAHPSVFVKKSVYTKYGAYSVGFKIAGDYDFILRIWEKVKKKFINEVLICMCLGGISTTSTTLSCRESMAVSILHGKNIFGAFFNYYFGKFKNFILIQLRSLGYRR